jgi:hypothetical protein
MDPSRVSAFDQTQGTHVNEQGHELTLDELEFVVGGSDLLALQAAMAAQQQGQTQASTTSKRNHETMYAILRNLRG